MYVLVQSGLNDDDPMCPVEARSVWVKWGAMMARAMGNNVTVISDKMADG